LAQLPGQRQPSLTLNDEAGLLRDRFTGPCDVAELDRLDPAALLAARWDGELDCDDEEPWRWETSRANEFRGLKRSEEGLTACSTS